MYATLPSVSELATTEPRTTAVIEQRAEEARRAKKPFTARRTPVPLSSISPSLVDAVILSEDAGFYQHGPFDWGEVRDAARQDVARRRFARGASTLTQQLAKNLFLGTEKTLWRKVREALLAIKLERTLPKRRILDLYLNAVEWGEGVFGVEAGAQTLFGVGSGSLDPAQASVMAAMLPAPRSASLSPPPRWLARHARRVLDLMRDEVRIDDAEWRSSKDKLEQILSGTPQAPAAPSEGEEEVPEALQGEEEVTSPAQGDR